MEFVTDQNRTIALHSVVCVKAYRPGEPRPLPNKFPNCHEIRIYFELVQKSKEQWETAFGQLIFTDEDECTRQFQKLRRMVIQL